ncbi:MAG: carboxypeptidase-like regulatory domain-containing protein [Bacteroidales bacterium]|nr:carboxypeptidase-like regulatory domain-containing protein [Bacteroidales bacterium]
MKHKIIALLLTLLPIATFAQEELYSIEGYIIENDFDIDDNLCAVPFVNVMLTDSTGKIVGGCQTDTNGKYHIYNIPKGEYTLNLRYIGYDKFDTLLTIESNTNMDTIFYWKMNKIVEYYINIVQNKRYSTYTNFYEQTYFEYRKALNRFYKKDGNLTYNIDSLLSPLKGIHIKAGWKAKYEYGSGIVMHKKFSKKKAITKLYTMDEYIEVDFTPQGIWSAFQLKKSYFYRPITCSYCYDALSIIFSTEEITSCLGKRNEKKQEAKNKIMQLLPLKNQVIITSDSTAELTAYFWNDWQGLIEEKVFVEQDGKSVRFIFYNKEKPDPRTSYKVLVPYKCGILF